MTIFGRPPTGAEVGEATGDALDGRNGVLGADSLGVGRRTLGAAAPDGGGEPRGDAGRPATVASAIATIASAATTTAASDRLGTGTPVNSVPFWWTGV